TLDPAWQWCGGREQEKITRRDVPQPGTRQQLLRLPRAQKNGVAIEFAARDRKARQGIERVVLDHANHAPAPRYALHLRDERPVIRDRNMVQDTDCPREVELRVG